jgi:hypothetical protein
MTTFEHTSILGITIPQGTSQAFNPQWYYAMRLEFRWIIQLFSDDSWKTDNLFRYAGSMIARRALLVDEVLELSKN